MSLPDDLFAFAAKPETQVERTQPKITGKEPTSDNDDYGIFASLSPFALATSDKLICARFWSHVDKNGPIHPVLGTRCWLWTANVVGHGNVNHPANSRHGQFTYRLNGSPQVHVYAHRFAWGIAHGAISGGLQVLHHCDVPPCVRSSHHFLGTQADNLRDAARKNRFTVPRTVTLSLLERLMIYQTPDYRGVCVDLARQYGVSKSCISLIRRGRFLGSGVWLGTKVDLTEIRVRRA